VAFNGFTCVYPAHRFWRSSSALTEFLRWPPGEHRDFERRFLKNVNALTQFSS